MASSGERRMLFDTSGKRKRVIQVVYAILALLMGASLFLVIGPFSLGELVGGSGSSSASKVFDEQVERIEGRLAQDPTDEQLLLALTRARISAGNAKVEVVSEGEVPTATPEGREEFAIAAQVWNRYLKLAGEDPSATTAQLVAATFFRLAETGGTLGEVQEYVSQAAKAQQIAAEQSPSIGSLSTVAIYDYFAGDFAGGDKAAKEAAAEATSKAEVKSLEKQLAAYRKRAERFAKQKKEASKVEGQANKESLQNPLGGFGGVPSGSLGE